ncbi:MAG: dihydrofolate reductase family protein [Coriobacteriia bacterium]|nr:dihydrofolate reductase family protein [Coriobacteriia bacterium]
MRRSVYYFTMSLDGYIADATGSVDWLAGAPNSDYGYKDFYQTVGSILLGRATYQHMLQMGDFFPYPDRDVTVFSSNEHLKRAGERVQILSEDPALHLARLQLGSADDGLIWIGGGGTLAGSLFAAGLIDELRVFVQPIVLGGGTPSLMGAAGTKGAARALELTLCKEWPAGIVELRYDVPKRWRSDV